MLISFHRKVNFYETDAQKIVHHSNYLRYLEEARGYFLEQKKYPYHEMFKEGYNVVLVEASLRIKSPLFFGDNFIIELKPYLNNDYSFSFDYVIKKENILISKALTKHCVVKDKKIIKIPSKLISIIKE